MGLSAPTYSTWGKQGAPQPTKMGEARVTLKFTNRMPNSKCCSSEQPTKMWEANSFPPSTVPRMCANHWYVAPNSLHRRNFRFTGADVDTGCKFRVTEEFWIVQKCSVPSKPYQSRHASWPVKTVATSKSVPRRSIGLWGRVHRKNKTFGYSLTCHFEVPRLLLTLSVLAAARSWCA